MRLWQTLSTDLHRVSVIQTRHQCGSLLSTHLIHEDEDGAGDGDGDGDGLQLYTIRHFEHIADMANNHQSHIIAIKVFSKFMTQISFLTIANTIIIANVQEMGMNERWR